MPRFRFAGLLVAAAAIVAGPAFAEVDAEVPLALKAKGTILPEGEMDLVRFDAVAGTQLTMKLAAVGRASAAPAAVLVGPGPAVLPVPDAATDPRKVQWKAFPLPDTGAYRIEITAAGTGAYSLSLKGKPQARWGADLALAAAGTGTYDFSAPAGSTLVFDARAARGSPAVPRLRTLDGAGGPVDLTLLGKRTATRHLVTLVGDASGGDHTLEVANEGGAGTVVVKVKVKPPKVKSLKLDVRAETLGRPEGSETYLRRMVGAGGGALVCDEDGCDLEGARAVVGAGAFATDIGVVLSSWEAPALKDEDAQYAGPGLSVGPAALAEAAPVTVTLPLDPRLLPVDAGADDVRVLVVDASGEAVAFPDVWDDVAGTVTIEVDGPCLMVPVVHAGMPRLEDTEYWGLFRSARLSGEPGGDSRGRAFGMELGTIAIADGGTGVATMSGREFEYHNNDGGVPGSIDAAAVANTWETPFPFLWHYGTDGQTAVIPGGEESTILVASRDGSVLVGRSESAETWVGADILLRKNTKPLTLASLAGSYHLVILEVSADGTTGPGAAAVRSMRCYATLKLDGAGGGSFAGAFRGAEYAGESGAWTHLLVQRTFAIDYEVAGDGTVRVGIVEPDPGAPTMWFRLFPGEDARILVGRDESYEPYRLMTLVALRQGTDLGVASLADFYAGYSLGMNPTSYTPDLGVPTTIFVPDFTVWGERLEIAFAGDGTANIDSAQKRLSRDETAGDGVRVDTGSDSFGATVSVTRQGKMLFRVDDYRVLGVLSSDAQAILILPDPAYAEDDYSLGLVVRPPPEKP